MIRKYAEIFCWKNVSSFCSAKATHIFSAKNIRILYIESAKTVKEMSLNELVRLTMLWTTGPRYMSQPMRKPKIRGVTSKDSDQPLHPPSMARVFVSPPFDSPEAVEGTWSAKTDQTAWMHRLIWVVTGSTSLIVGYVMRWRMLFAGLFIIANGKMFPMTVGS